MSTCQSKNHLTDLQTEDDVPVERVLWSAVALLSVLVRVSSPFSSLLLPLVSSFVLLPPALPFSPLDALPGRYAGINPALIIRIHCPELRERRLSARKRVQSADAMTQFALDTKDEDRRTTGHSVLVDAKRGHCQQVVVLADEMAEGPAPCTPSEWDEEASTI
jgi:hypothetical protein